MKRVLLILAFGLMIAPMAQSQLMDRVSRFVNVKGSETITHEASVPMMIVEPDDEGYFNPSVMRRSYRDIQLPGSKITIVHPEMDGYRDTAYMMMFIRDEAYLESGFVNIAVIGIVNDNELHYYIDNNSNYFYEEGETRITFTPEEEKVRLEMKTRRGTNEFYLFNPVYSKQEKLMAAAELEWKSPGNKPEFYVDLSGTFGSGNASISYVPTTANILKTDYRAQIFAYGLFRAGPVIKYRNFNLGVYAGFEQVQYTERNRYNQLVGEGSDQILYMSGLWMWSKVSLETALEYDIKLGNRLKLSPLVAAGMWMPVDNRIFDDDLNPSTGAKYIDTWKYEYGFKLKLLISQESFVYLRAGHITTFFDARQYLTDYSDDYSQTYKQGYLGIGFTRELFSKN